MKVQAFLSKNIGYNEYDYTPLTMKVSVKDIDHAQTEAVQMAAYHASEVKRSCDCIMCFVYDETDKVVAHIAKTGQIFTKYLD